MSDPKINVLTERQRCARRCRTTNWRIDKIHPNVGDARRCEHGRWWVATGEKCIGVYYSTLDLWRPASWMERRRIERKAGESDADA